MWHKKVIERENGDEVQIHVSYSFTTLKYELDLVTIQHQGKTERENNLNAATPEEIHTAKLELWELLKPIK